MAADPDVDYTELLGRAAKGDQLAWNTLVGRLTGRVWAIARSYSLPSADAEDVVQVAFVRLLNHIETIREPAKVSAWLATTARREALRVIAQRERYHLVENEEELDVVDVRASAPDAEVVHAERDAAVLRAFRRLPPACQQVLRLLIDPDLSYADVSEILHRPIGSLGPMRQRCLQQLRRLLGITGSGDGVTGAGGPND